MTLCYFSKQEDVPSADRWKFNGAGCARSVTVATIATLLEKLITHRNLIIYSPCTHHHDRET